MTETDSVAGTLFEKPQTTNNGQIIVVNVSFTPTHALVLSYNKIT